MRKLIILSMMTAGILVSCEKDPDPVSTVVDISYPTITLNGPEFVHIAVNGAYTEQGAVLTDDLTGAQSPAPVKTNDLDPTTPGIYQVIYEAANANGFKTQAIRTILVLDYTPPPGLDSTFDISGDYLRAATGVITQVVKLENGLYISDHIGGSTPVPAYFVTPDTSTFDIPLQITAGGLQLEGTDEALDNSDPAHTKLVYRVLASGFGTSLRTFVKQ